MLRAHSARIGKRMIQWPAKLKRRLGLLARIRQGGEWGLFARLLLFAAAVPWLMKLRLLRAEQWLVPRSPARRVDPARVQKIIAYTDTALHFGRPLVQAKCLTRAVTLYYFLSRSGVDLTLIFGATSVDGKFSAHCWLEHDGRAFAEDPDPGNDYAVLYTIPAQAPSPATGR